MANSATLIDKIPIVSNGINYQVQTYNVFFDTINTDLSILTPGVTDQRLFVVGQFASDPTADNITYISQSPNLTGTITTTNGSGAITGLGTNFSKDFLNGGPPFSIVTSAGDTLAITSVTDDLDIVAANATHTQSGQTYQRRLTLGLPKLASNQGIYDKVGSPGFIVATWPGDSLILRSSAAYNEILLYIVQAKTYALR